MTSRTPMQLSGGQRHIEESPGGSPRCAAECLDGIRSRERCVCNLGDSNESISCVSVIKTAYQQDVGHAEGCRFSFARPTTFCFGSSFWPLSWLTSWLAGAVGEVRMAQAGTSRIRVGGVVRSRPALPQRCVTDETETGRPTLTTRSTSGTLHAIPAASVAQRTRIRPDAKPVHARSLARFERFDEKAGVASRRWLGRHLRRKATACLHSSSVPK
jgi:hypothetical protein